MYSYISFTEDVLKEAFIFYVSIILMHYQLLPQKLTSCIPQFMIMLLDIFEQNPRYSYSHCSYHLYSSQNNSLFTALLSSIVTHSHVALILFLLKALAKQQHQLQHVPSCCCCSFCCEIHMNQRQCLDFLCNNLSTAILVLNLRNYAGYGKHIQMEYYSDFLNRYMFIRNGTR